MLGDNNYRTEYHQPYRQMYPKPDRGVQRGTGGGFLTTPSQTTSQPDAITNTGYAGDVGGSGTGVLGNPGGAAASASTAAQNPWQVTDWFNPTAANMQARESWGMPDLGVKNRAGLDYMQLWVTKYPRIAQAMGMTLPSRHGRVQPVDYGGGHGGSGLRLGLGYMSGRQAAQRGQVPYNAENYAQYQEAMRFLPRPPLPPPEVRAGMTMGNGQAMPGFPESPYDAPWWQWPFNR
jgi:hypothetical protein